MDDYLTGTNSITEAIELQSELHALFLEGGFVLRKWNSSEPEVLKTISSELKYVPAVETLPSPGIHQNSWSGLAFW